jgi:hypothetical protein
VRTHAWFHRLYFGLRPLHGLVHKKHGSPEKARRIALCALRPSPPSQNNSHYRPGGPGGGAIIPGWGPRYIALTSQTSLPLIPDTVALHCS